VSLAQRLRRALGVGAAAALAPLLLPAAIVILAAAVTPAGAAGSSPPRLDVKAAALIDAGSGQKLYGIRARAELAIASATKIMTALIALEHERLARVFTAPPYQLAPVDSQIGLQAGERMNVADLIAAMMLPSADDAAHDLAYNIGGGSVGRFVAMMNARAASLGLTRTHYSTPVGLDTPGNFSSASDLVALARYALRTQPFLRHVVAMPKAKIRIGSQTRVVANLNGLIGRVSWVNGVKTGHTLGAGYVLVGSGRRDGMTMISAVLGASSQSSRESDTLALLEWGFDNFRTVAPVSAGQVVTRVPVRGRKGLETALVASGSFSHVVARATPVTTVVDAPRELRGPLRKGAVAGTLVVLEGGVPVARVPLRLARAVPAPPSGLSPTTILGPFTLVLLVLLLGVAVVRARRERLTARRVSGQRQE
jgi:serine-type D-Ala-D-Ala carboxypeptidase (penicillin-binding protein 5/6)